MDLSEQEQQSLIRNLPEDLQLSDPGFISENDLLEAIAQKVAEMLRLNRDVFFQLMYRMDIDEHKLRVALQQADVPLSVARLIYERQLDKIAFRRAQQERPDKDSDLSW